MSNSSEGMWLKASWLLVHMQHRMRFCASTSAVKDRRLNASFSSTHWGYTLGMCCMWLAGSHTERAHVCNFSEVEVGVGWVCLNVSMGTHITWVNLCGKQRTCECIKMKENIEFCSTDIHPLFLWQIYLLWLTWLSRECLDTTSFQMQPWLFIQISYKV